MQMYESRHFLLELLLAAVMGGHERRGRIEEVK